MLFMKDVIKTALDKDRKLREKLSKKTYRKDGKLRKDVNREVEYVSVKDGLRETSKDA